MTADAFGGEKEDNGHDDPSGSSLQSVSEPKVLFIATGASDASVADMVVSRNMAGAGPAMSLLGLAPKARYFIAS